MTRTFNVGVDSGEFGQHIGSRHDVRGCVKAASCILAAERNFSYPLPLSRSLDDRYAPHPTWSFEPIMRVTTNDQLDPGYHRELLIVPKTKVA